MVESAISFVVALLGVTNATALKILNSIVILCGIVLLRIILTRILRVRAKDIKMRYLWKKTIEYSTTAIFIISMLALWLNNFTGFGTFFGLTSAALAISLKEPLVNIAGWFFIVWRRPFTIGDRIQVGDNAGDVIDIRLFQFTIMEIGNWVDADQSTGRIIHISNGQVFSMAIANYSKGFEYIWNEIPVLLTFESDWENARKILQKIAERHSLDAHTAAQKKIEKASTRYMIFYTHLTPTVYTAVRDSGILLTIRYLCAPRKRRGTENDIWIEILQEFRAHRDIDFAYPTQRFYNNTVEAKNVRDVPNDNKQSRKQKS